LLENTGKNSGYATGGGDTAIATIVGNVISTFISILGILFLLYTLYGGYIWLIARGNEEKVNTAKDTLKNGIIGLIIVLSAYAISYFIIDAIKGKTLTP
jgi:TRAP-type C4-dicarboxylate transport system permease small subunit